MVTFFLEPNLRIPALCLSGSCGARAGSTQGLIRQMMNIGTFKKPRPIAPARVQNLDFSTTSSRGRLDYHAEAGAKAGRTSKRQRRDIFVARGKANRLGSRSAAALGNAPKNTTFLLPASSSRGEGGAQRQMRGQPFLCAFASLRLCVEPPGAIERKDAKPPRRNFPQPKLKILQSRPVLPLIHSSASIFLSEPGSEKIFALFTVHTRSFQNPS